MIKLFMLTAAVLALSACGGRFSRFQDTRTIHDSAATRIWIIQDTVDEQHIVLCDTAMLAQMHALCMRATIIQAPGGAVQRMSPGASTTPSATSVPAAIRAASAR